MRFTATDRVYLDRELKRTNWLTRFEPEVQSKWKETGHAAFYHEIPWIYLCSASLVHWSQTPCLPWPPMGTGSWQSPAQDSNIFKRALGTHFAKLNHCDPLLRSWSLKQMSSCFSGGVMAMVGSPCPANKLIDSWNDSCRPSRCSVCFLVSCTRAGAHHCMTRWEASAGWLTMGLSTSYHGGIYMHQQLWNNLKITNFEIYVETNSDRCDVLQRNGIWWLADSFMAESFKHLICSRTLGIMSSTVACRMALHDMPNPHVINHANCLSWAKGSQTKTANIFSIKLLGPLCHASWLAGYTPDLEESSFPFLAIAIKELTFKRSVQQ